MIDRPLSQETTTDIGRIIQIGRQAVRDAQDESRRLGVANVYSLGGRLYYELPTGELSLTPPLLRDSAETG
jgi:hypothetical protein